MFDAIALDSPSERTGRDMLLGRIEDVGSRSSSALRSTRSSVDGSEQDRTPDEMRACAGSQRLNTELFVSTYTVIFEDSNNSSGTDSTNKRNGLPGGGYVSERT